MYKNYTSIVVSRDVQLRTGKSSNSYNLQAKWLLNIMLLFGMMFSGFKGSAQTILISPTGAGGFELGTTLANNGWIAVNNATNAWNVGTATSSAGTKSAYISNTSGTTYAYSNTTAAVSHFYRDITVPAGETNILISFKYKGDGDVSGTTYYDKLLVYTAPTTFTPTTAAPTSPNTTLSGATLIYAQASVNASYVTIAGNLPAALAGTTFRLIFTWQDDTTTGTVPSSVDEISLTSAAITPLTGTKTIDNTLATAGNNYSSFTAAISALNTNGVGSGGVTFNVASGETFTENPTSITATGTLANPIIFQKSGAGANPIISASGSTGTEAAILISGGDYLTFDGINITASGTALEYGYYLQNASATNGTQNNTFKNFTVTLNRSNGLSVGVVQLSAFTPSSAANANSNNKFYNFTIKNANAGIQLAGATGFPDLNCEIGTTACGTRNTIGDPLTADDIVYSGVAGGNTSGIRVINQSAVKVFNNDVTNITSSINNSTVDGIFVDNSAATVALGTSEVYNNKISGITNTGGGTNTATYVRGIRANGNTVAGTVTRIYNNFVSNLQTGCNATTGRRIQGISLQPVGGGSGSSIYCEFNSVRIAATNLIPSNTCFEIGVSSGPVFRVRNNIFVNVTATQPTQKHYTWVSTSATLVGAAGSLSNYNDLYVSGTNGFVGLGNATDYATLTNWQNATSQDANSLSTDPTFTSATDLHAAAVALNGAADPSYATNTAWATVDIDCATRPALTDIGADEFVIAVSSVLNPTSFTATTASGVNSASQINLVSTANGNGDNVVVVFNATGTFTAPTDGSAPGSVGTTLTGSGGTIVYAGSAAGLTNHTSLTGNTQYFYKAFSYDGTNTYSTGLTANATTAKIEPSNQPTAFATGTITTSNIPLTWTAAAAGSQAPDGYLIKLNTGSITDPTDFTDVTNATAITAGAANVKVTPGTAAAYSSFTGATAGTMYNYKIYSYTNSGSLVNWNTTSAPSLNAATKPNAVTSSTFTASSSTTATISWTAPTGYVSGTNSTLVFVKAASAVTTGTPSSAPSVYSSVSTDFSTPGTAYQNDAAAYCVFNGDGTSVSLSGLTEGVTYNVLIYAVVDASNSAGGNSYSAATVPTALTMPPANDFCAGAIVIPNTTFPVLTTAVNNAAATNTNDPTPTCQTNFNRSIWYSFTPITSGNYAISTCPDVAPNSAAFDNVLAIYTGTCGSPVQVYCNDDLSSCSSSRSAGFEGVALNGGTTYYIIASSFSANSGIIQIQVNYLPPPTVDSFASSGCTGSSLVITGTNLSGASAVTIGGTAATITGNTATSVTVTVGSGTTGIISVTCTNGIATSSSNFTVNPLPTVTWAASAASVCGSTSSQDTTLAYTARTNSPDKYSITWNASPTNSFAPITDQAQSFSSTSGSINVAVPASTAVGTYTGTIKVKTANGCQSTATQTFTVAVTSPAITIAGATICQNASSANMTASATCPTAYVTNNTFSMTDIPASGAPTYSRSAGGTTYSSSTTVAYSTQIIRPTTTGSYIINGCGSGDTHMQLYTSPFTPGTPSVNFLEANDEGNNATCTNDPRITRTLTAGVDYVLVYTNFYAATATTGITITITPPGGGNIQTPTGAGVINWYTVSSGGSALSITGSPFNPVGVLNSGLADTATPSTTTYYAACSTTPSCRTSALYVINPNFTIDASAGTHGGISPSGTSSFTCLGTDSQTYTMTPAACYSIADVVVDGVSQGAVGTYTFTNVMANHTISASFVLNTYSIAVTAGANGSITPTTGSVNCGSNATYTIIPNACYSISNVIVDGVSQGAVGTYTFTNVTAAHSISATFILNGPYTFTYTAASGGTLSGTTSQTVACGASGSTVTAIANACNTFTGWSDGVLTASRTDMNAQANVSVTANFTLNGPYTFTYTAASGGTLSGTTPQTVACGASGSTVTAIANACNTFTGWSDGVLTASRTDLNAQANINVTANFLNITPTWYLDADGDGYYTGAGVVSCTSPGAGYTTAILTGGGDCEDGIFAINPGATEICYNNIDDNCNTIKSEGCAPVVVNMDTLYNGIPLPSLATAIPAFGYSYAPYTNLKYRFFIKNVTTGATVEFTQSSRFVNIPLAIHAYNATYTIKASAVINDEVVPYAGNTITILSPVVQLVKLSSASCGATLASLTTTLSANPGLNATGYTFRIRLTSDVSGTNYGYSSSSTRIISANSFTGFPLSYATNYQVAVQYTFNDPVTGLPVESGYGTECTVITPSIPLIGIASPTCGSSTAVASLTANISAFPGAYAISYQFRIRKTSNLSGPYTESVPNGSRFSSLTAFATALEYNTQYSLSVQYSISNNSATVWSGYGAECVIKTPFFPTTYLVQSQCGTSTPTSLTQQLNIVAYPGFPNYKVRLTEVIGEDLGTSEDIVVGYPYFKLNQFAMAQTNKVYNVTVAIKLNGVFGDFSSPPCDIFTGTPPAPKTITPFKATAYPNPFANNFMLDVKTSSQSAVSLKVYDMVGRLIDQRDVSVSDLESTTIGDRYPSGVYNVVVSQEDSIQTVRVVKR